jgi:hypothetical protein
MSDQGREAYEAMIAAAKAYGVFGSVGGCVAVMGNRIRAWQDAGAWLPTEQHETVAAILVEIDNHLAADNLDDDLDKVVAPWLKAGKPGFPKPVDPYGPVITVDTGGRCPVEGDEVIKCWYVGSRNSVAEGPAGRMRWQDNPMVFRRIKADHPGDSYWHGREETIPKDGRPDLKVWEKLKLGTRTDILPACAWDSWAELGKGCTTFRRWLKSDA